MKTDHTSNPNPTWRQFNFFNSHPLQSSTDLAKPPPVLGHPQSISTIVAGFGSTIVGHLDGRISLLDPSLDLLRSWSAFPGGRTLLVKPTSIKGVLISIGEESGSSVPALKIWNLRHEDKQSSAPQLLGYSKILNGNRPHPVTTLALAPNLSHLAVGLADGHVLLYRRLDQTLVSAATAAQNSRSAPPLPKPKIIYSSPEPITGLGFRIPKMASTQSYSSNLDSSDPVPQSPSTQRNTCLFIITTAKVLCVFTSGRAAGTEPIVMDDLGGSIGCSEMMENGDLILADETALYVYGPEGRGACLAYEGPKAKLKGWGNYLVITSPPSFAGGKNEVEQTRVIVFDLQNRFIAYSASFRGAVQHVWAEWGELYVLTASAEVIRLVERSLSEKLSLLYDKDMYILATNVAKSSGADASELSDIYRRFGDYLYQKSDYEGAVQQYINTIGNVQPSIIVRKFLDAQRITNLTSYLQELHARGVANADHTTLLLNCYTKLKDHAKLNDFIKANERTCRDSSDQLPFDLETAIRVCRQAGYFEPALYLAKQYRQDEEYLRIQVEDRGEWLDAIRFMRSLGNDQAEANLLRYGKPLLANLPEETTDLMIDVCSGVTLQPKRSSSVSPKPLSDRTHTRTQLSPRPSSLAIPKLASPQRFDETVNSEADKLTPPCLPSIREFFAFFIDQPQCFIRFLETIAWRRWGEKTWEEDDVNQTQSLPQGWVNISLASSQGRKETPKSGKSKAVLGKQEEEDREAVWGTLLELYLQRAAEVGAGDISMKQRALSLLRKGASGEKLCYEPTQALIVCLTHDFVPGIILLYDRLGMVEDIMRFWIDRSEDPEEAQDPRAQIFQTLDKYGDSHPELYPIVLRYLASSNHYHETIDSHNSTHVDHQETSLENVLLEIEKRKIMSPIQVVEILSKPGSVASIGTVKKYLLNQVLSQKHQIESDAELIKSYRQEISKKQTEIQDLVEKPKIFNVNNKCSSCLTALDLPVIHFMCQHSFHQRCLGDEEFCLKCNDPKTASHPNQAIIEMMNVIKRNKTFIHNESTSSGDQNNLLIKTDSNSHRIEEHHFFVDEVREADDPCSSSSSFFFLSFFFFCSEANFFFSRLVFVVFC